MGKALPLVNTADKGIKVGARAAAGFVHMDQQTAFTLAWPPPQDLIAVNQSSGASQLKVMPALFFLASRFRGLPGFCTWVGVAVGAGVSVGKGADGLIPGRRRRP